MKKILCLVLILLFTVSITAYALPDKPDVSLRCSCGGTNVYIGISEGEWNMTSSKRNCVHGHGGYDIKSYRDVTDFYECSSCGNSIRLSYREFDWLCGSEMLQKSAAVNVNKGRAESCGTCRTTMSPYKTQYGVWEGPIATGQTPNGILYKYERTVYYFYKCPNCGAPEATTYLEYKWSDINM